MKSFGRVVSSVVSNKRPDRNQQAARAMLLRVAEGGTAVLFLAAAALWCPPAWSQAKDKAAPTAPAAAPAKKAEPEAKAAPQPQIVMPDADKILLLVRTTLLTLNDAIRTGNYSVLREVASPGFGVANSSGGLAHSFAGLASRGIEMSAVAVMAPTLTDAPTLDPNTKLLRLKGLFPAADGGHLKFELVYQPVVGHWRVLAIGLEAAPAKAAQADPAAQPKAGPPNIRK